VKRSRASLTPAALLASPSRVVVDLALPPSPSASLADYAADMDRRVSALFEEAASVLPDLSPPPSTRPKLFHTPVAMSARATFLSPFHDDKEAPFFHSNTMDAYAGRSVDVASALARAAPSTPAARWPAPHGSAGPGGSPPAPPRDALHAHAGEARSVFHPATLLAHHLRAEQDESHRLHALMRIAEQRFGAR
jgi:hypothetical protein